MIRTGIVGVGDIARKQHVPVIAAHPAVTLVATASREGAVEAVPSYGSLGAMLAGGEDVEAVVLCVPPEVRIALAHEAVAASRHVFLEKPPGQTVAEVRALEAAAQAAGVTLFASWHSRYAAAVEPLRAALEGAAIRRVSVTWREDVRVYHPGQRWIWEPGGFGAFDPGINALSILTHVLPRPFHVTGSTLHTPVNCAQPIRVDLAFADTAGVPIEAVFDFDQPDPPTWDIEVTTDGPVYRLAKGGAQLFRDGETLIDAQDEEYAGLYHRFAALIASRSSDVDLAPLVHVADAFMLARHREAKAFHE